DVIARRGKAAVQLEHVPPWTSADEVRAFLERIEAVHRRSAQSGIAERLLAEGAIVLQPLADGASADDAESLAAQVLLLGTAPRPPEGLMLTVAAALFCFLLCCRSGPDARPPEPPPAAAVPASPANPPATQVTGAQPTVPNAAGQPTASPAPAAPERPSAAAAPQAPAPGIDLSALDRGVNPCEDF